MTYTGSAKTFTLSEIVKATDNFDASRILGEGGFGLVYSGILDYGKEVAVKILKRYDLHGGREFLAEVEMLSRLHHRNLVKLIGICTEEKTRCLVYELVPNGSVESHLHGSSLFYYMWVFISDFLSLTFRLYSQVLTRKLIHWTGMPE